jgi:CspA family cold shock protein
MSDEVQTGTVKWFNNAKGFGFILPNEGDKDVFAHYSAIAMEGYKTLKAGQQVQFQTEDGPKGLHALNIKAAEAEPAVESADSAMEAQN